MAAVAGTALLPMHAKAVTRMATGDSGFLISTPNPSSKHLSVGAAKQICIDAEHEKGIFGGLFLKLQDYNSASPEALRYLSCREWGFADFGLANLTMETATAIKEIPILCCETHHHLKRLTPDIARRLVLGNRPLYGHDFKNIVDVAPSIIRALGQGTPATALPSHGFGLSGNFTINQELADALAEQTINIHLDFSRADQSLADPYVARVLASHQGSRLHMADLRGSLDFEEKNAPGTNPFSTEVQEALASNPAKRLTVSEPTWSNNPWLGHWRVELA
jgi:hypothetical protein